MKAQMELSALRVIVNATKEFTGPFISTRQIYQYIRLEFSAENKEVTAVAVDGYRMIETVLEPSAGKGDLIECLIKAASAGYRRHGRGLNIDCIEIDPYLRQILKYNFSLEATKKQRDRWRDLDQKCHANRSEAEQSEMKLLRRELDAYDSANIHIVHDNFLTFQTEKHYGLIVMDI